MAQPDRRLIILVLIVAGGALGGGARYALAHLWPPVPGGFPWATFAENCAGALLLGMLMVFVTDVWPDNPYVRPFLGVGVLGGFTTFSTFATEADALLRGGATGLAAGYLAATVTVGLLATALGVGFGRRLLASGWMLRRRIPRAR